MKPDSSRSSRNATAPRRWLLPREHGAYGQLAFPLVSALALGHLHGAAVALVGAAVALFIAHEPLIVLRGERGKRRLDAERARAQWQLAAWLVIGLGAAAVAFAMSAGTELWRAAAIPAVLGAVSAGFLLRGEERTTAGEVLVAIALAAAALPVAVANGVSLHNAGLVALAWAAVSSLHVLAVRGILARGRSNGTARFAAVATGLAVLIAVATVWAVARGVLPGVSLAAIGPAVIVTCVFFAWPPPLKKLKTVGWALIGSSAATLVALLAVGHR